MIFRYPKRLEVNVMVYVILNLLKQLSLLTALHFKTIKQFVTKGGNWVFLAHLRESESARYIRKIVITKFVIKVKEMLTKIYKEFCGGPPRFRYLYILVCI